MKEIFQAKDKGSMLDRATEFVRRNWPECQGRRRRLELTYEIHFLVDSGGARSVECVCGEL